ncbi:uncharacterized protein ACIQIH_017656 isoform 1-T1 [Cyanocitta cristata]
MHFRGEPGRAGERLRCPGSGGGCPVRGCGAQGGCGAHGRGELVQTDRQPDRWTGTRWARPSGVAGTGQRARRRTLSRPLADHTPWPGHWDPLEPPAVTRTRGKRCHRLSPRSPCPQETPPRGRRVVTRVGVVGVQVTEKGRTKGKAGLEPWNSHSRGDSSKIPLNLSGDQR